MKVRKCRKLVDFATAIVRKAFASIALAVQLGFLQSLKFDEFKRKKEKEKRGG